MVLVVLADSIKRRLPRFTMHQLLEHLKVRLYGHFLAKV
jgi:hypothetical protein